MPAAPISPLFIPLPLAHSFRPITHHALSSYYNIIHNLPLAYSYCHLFITPEPLVLNYCSFYFVSFISVHYPLDCCCRFLFVNKNALDSSPLLPLPITVFGYAFLLIIPSIIFFTSLALFLMSVTHLDF